MFMCTKRLLLFSTVLLLTQAIAVIAEATPLTQIIQPVAVYGSGSDQFTTTASIADASFSKDGSMVVLADGGDNSIDVVNTKTMKLVDTVPNIPCPLGLAFIQNGTKIVVVSAGNLYIVTVSDWSVQEIPIPAKDYCYAADQSGNIYAFFQEEPAAAHYNRMLVVTKTGRQIVNLAGKWEFNGGAAVSPDGKFLVVGDNQFFRVIDTSTFQIIKTISMKKETEGWVADVIAFSVHGKLIAISNQNDGSVLVYRTGNWSFCSKLTGLTAEPDDFQFSTDGSQLFTFGDPDGVTQWDIKSAKQIATYKPGSLDVSCGEVSTDATQLVLVDWSNHANLYQLSAMPTAPFLTPAPTQSESPVNPLPSTVISLAPQSAVNEDNDAPSPAHHQKRRHRRPAGTTTTNENVEEALQTIFTPPVEAHHRHRKSADETTVGSEERRLYKFKSDDDSDLNVNLTRQDSSSLDAEHLTSPTHKHHTRVKDGKDSISAHRRSRLTLHAVESTSPPTPAARKHMKHRHKIVAGQNPAN